MRSGVRKSVSPKTIWSPESATDGLGASIGLRAFGLLNLLAVVLLAIGPLTASSAAAEVTEVPDEKAFPVVVVVGNQKLYDGFASTRLSKELASQGRKVYLVNPKASRPRAGASTTPLQALGNAVGPVVKRALSETNQTEASFVGHGSGGLALRWYLEQGGGAAYVHRLVFAGVPHTGSLQGNIYGWRNGKKNRCTNLNGVSDGDNYCWDYARGSRFMQFLNGPSLDTNEAAAQKAAKEFKKAGYQKFLPISRILHITPLQEVGQSLNAALILKTRIVNIWAESDRIIDAVTPGTLVGAEDHQASKDDKRCGKIQIVSYDKSQNSPSYFQMRGIVSVITAGLEGKSAKVSCAGAAKLKISKPAKSELRKETTWLPEKICRRTPMPHLPEVPGYILLQRLSGSGKTVDQASKASITQLSTMASAIKKLRAQGYSCARIQAAAKAL